MRILAAALVSAAAASATAAYGAGELDAALGKALFERDWVPAPASTNAADGLGPLFAARSCSGCHAGAGLSARFTDAPDGRIAGRGLVLRFGDSTGRPDSLYGRLLQTQAMQGLKPEGRIVLTTGPEDSRSHVTAVTLDDGAPDPATRQSMRIAPPLIGRAALERIDADAVAGFADPADIDGDGISGRLHLVATGAGKVLGRYGWKAEIGSLEEQVADAFAVDMGLSSLLRPFPHGDCTALQSECMNAPAGESDAFEGHELSQEMIGFVVAFLRSLPHPKAPAGLAADSRGAQLFASSGCTACHVPNLPASDGTTVAAYSDLLLHDMGPGLDDGVGAMGASSSEWRTAPLVAMVPENGRRYLHDGRAASVEAAVAAHGGEAEEARRRFTSLEDAERAALIAFVEAL
jgi:CxxC motif-containing protein (DUF1111 family)